MELGGLGGAGGQRCCLTAGQMVRLSVCVCGFSSGSPTIQIPGGKLSLNVNGFGMVYLHGLWPCQGRAGALPGPG